MAGTIVVDRIESDASYASTINVAGQITFSNTVNFGAFAGTAPVAGFYLPTTNNLAFTTASTERMRIDSSGNVGIGTTSPTASSSNRTFTVNAPATFTSLMDLKTNETLNLRVFGGVSNSGLSVKTATPLLFDTNDTERMRIDSSGNVGIGTTSPVNNAGYGGLTLNGTSGSIYSMMYNGTENLRLFAGNNEGSIQYGSSGVLTFFDGVSGGTERMRIDSSGNLLVGTTTDNITATGIRLRGDNIQVAKSGDWSLRTGRTSSTGIVQEIYYNSSRVGDIATNGTGTSYNSASDYRLKNTVAPMTGALAKVAALKPVTYKWNVDDSNGEGFIAHELAEVVPDAVRGTKDEVDADGNPIYQGIDTSFLVVTLTAAIQEQQALITQQAEAITALTTRITALESN